METYNVDRGIHGKTKPTGSGKKDMFSILEFVTESVAWLQIAASPTLLGSLIGAVVYFSSPGAATLIVGITIAVLGSVVGAIWATRVWKRQGTMRFMSKVNASPDLDGPEKK